MGKRIGLSRKRSDKSGRITDFSQISKLIDFKSNDVTSDMEASIIPYDIPTEFIGCNAIIQNSNEKCFLNPFSEDDVQFFIKEFQNPIFQNQLQYAEKQKIIENSIISWRRKKEKNGRVTNPLESALYALKLSDGILASASNVSDPNPKLLDAFANGFLLCWDTDSKEDTKIICHILANWDWYQPLLVVMRMYQLQENYNNSELDEIIRERKLFTPDYAVSAFECLINHISIENAEALLKFVSKTYQEAVITRAEIYITKKERELFNNMYLYSAYSFQDEIKALYINKYREYSDAKSRRILDELFGIIIEPPSEIEKHFREYRASSAEERKTHYFYLAKNWDLSDSKQQRICRNIYNEELLDLVKKKVGSLSGYAYGSVMMNLALGNYDKAQKYIKQEMSCMTKDNRKWLGCACAANLVDGSPSMYEIAREFFVNGNGYSNSIQLQWLTKTPAKAKELRDEVNKIITNIYDSPEKYGVFFNSCQHLYFGEYVTSGYSTEIDNVIKKGVDYARKDNPRLVFDILGVIDNIINRNNRDRYRDILHQIYYEDRFSMASRNKAKQILYRVYSG